MVRLAGEVADGVAVGVMTSTEFLKNHVRPGARAGAEAAGRDPDALAFPMGALVSVNRDPERAREAVRGSICSLFHPVPHPYYSSQLRQLGFGEFADQAAELMRSGREKEAMSRVPEPVVETMTIAGTPAECAARIREYEGLADEVIALRVAQPDDAPGVAAYGDFFELASLVA